MVSTAMSWYYIPLIICCFMCLYRIAAGPSAPDRAMAIDILGTIVVGICAIYALYMERSIFLNISISWALLSFIGTITLAKYLEGRNFDD